MSRRGETARARRGEKEEMKQDKTTKASREI